MYFGRGQNCFVTNGEITRIETDSMQEAEDWWNTLRDKIENETEMPGAFGIGPLAIRSFVFDPAATKQKSVLIVPETIVGHRDGIFWLTKIGFDRVTPTLPPVQDPPEPAKNLRFEQGPLSDYQWMMEVKLARAFIRSGDAQKIVLARKTYAHSDEPFDPRWALLKLAGNYASCWNYMVDGLVGATPEMLVMRSNGLTISRILAGTIPALEDISDENQAARLISSSKDLHEHELAVESVVRQLKPYFQGMHVPSAPYVLRLPNVLHLASDIGGVTYPEYNVLSLARAAHPTAAVCGTPTDVAREYIAANERMDRGRYAGPVGWIDTQGDGEWALALRCGQVDDEDPTKMHLYAGGGIMADSRPHSELVETESKLNPIKSALRENI